MKKVLLSAFCVFTAFTFAQEKNTFTGSFESNGQWYLNDKSYFDQYRNPTVHPEYPVRSNNYLLLNYKIKDTWTFGLQAEAYQDQALLNYNPKFKDNNIGLYFAQYKNSKVEITAGYFYEQFGSGLLLRSWEDRALGINNALRGGRIIFKPCSFVTLKTLYGQQRTGFDVSDGKIYGTDLDISLSDAFKMEKNNLSLGLSYVGRYEKVAVPNIDFNPTTNAFSGRVNYSNDLFYISSEYNYKAKDVVVQQLGQMDVNFVKPGSALLLNTGFTKKGFGLDATFRRLENMRFYSERLQSGNRFNDMIVNYLPGLTKQHHYNLANIYVYQAQAGVLFNDVNKVQAGEIGGQIDLFYNFKKGTSLGGKYGTKIALNYSQYHGLSGDYYLYPPQDYKVDYLGFGEKYYSDANIEITKKWNPKLQTIFSYINQYYNSDYLNTHGHIYTNIAGADVVYKFGKQKSVHLQAEHMWVNADRKNWASLLAEFNLSSKYTIYASDMYNYGNDLDYNRTHYFTIGNAFRYKSLRAAVAYGRQREGLICVGGVCRWVPASSGVSLNVNFAF